jgi:hypothetical protein
VCSKAQWDRTDPDHPKGPECQEIWQYIAYSVDHDMPVEIVFSRTGTPAANFINLQMRLKGQGNFAVRLGSSTEKSKSGGRGGSIYFVPKPTLDPSVESHIMDQAKQMMKPQVAIESGS